MTLRETYAQCLERQPVLPAPMCGISDHAFRQLCREAGATLTTTQMIAAQGVVQGHAVVERSLDLAEGEREDGLIIQLFGGDPDALGEAARRLSDRAAVLDLNMGCPARKIIAHQAGSALLCDLPRVAAIFHAMRAATPRPLTVKMRWDWDGQGTAALEAAHIAESEGLDGICLHARTRQQGYSGEADWDAIARLKAAVSIPVVGNGDVRRPADAVEMRRRTGCDAVMIGRALMGAPWLLRDALDAMAVRDGEAAIPYAPPAWPERRALMLRHAAWMAERHGTRGVIHFRKHAACYVRGLRGAKRLREALVRVSTLDELADALPIVLPDALHDTPDEGPPVG